MSITSIYRVTLFEGNGVNRVGTDTFKCALATASYSPNLDTHNAYDDITNEVANGNGYTTGGATIASFTKTYTAANSWGTARANSTAYVVGQVVIPATPNGYVYQCVVAGTSGGSLPTYPTVIGTTVADGTVTWLCAGRGVMAFDANDVSWSASTITARYGIIYNDTPAAAGNKILCALIDFESNISSTNATFQVTWHAQGILLIPIP